MGSYDILKGGRPEKAFKILAGEYPVRSYSIEKLEPEQLLYIKKANYPVVFGFSGHGWMLEDVHNSPQGWIVNLFDPNNLKHLDDQCFLDLLPEGSYRHHDKRGVFSINFEDLKQFVSG